MGIERFMRSAEALFAGFLVFWAAGSIALAAQDASRTREPWLDPSTEARVDAVFAAVARPGTPGYAVGLVRNGELVYAKGFGEANLDDHVAITRQTVFHLASVSKQFTGAAVARLALDGKLSLDDPVAKFIPEAAKYGPALRIKHLVYMTSGLHEYTDLPRASGQPWMTFYYFTRDEAIRAALKPDKLEFASGTDWAYRNINFMLLTRIVEVVSGQSFATYMREQFFAPLGMDATDINDDTTLVVSNRATGYARRDDPRVVKELSDNGVTIRPGDGWVRLVRVSPHFGGSGVFSNLDDLAKWDANWYSQRAGGSGFTEWMTRRMRFQHDKDDDAVGLVWRTLYGKEMLDYSGGDTDTSTYMARFPDQRFTIICLSNMPLGDAESKAHEVLEILHAAGRI